jgi:hypothetical protein
LTLLSACPQIKEEEAERERQQDLRYMQQQREQLDRQEAQRRQLLEKVKAVQVGGLVSGCVIGCWWLVNAGDG